MAQHDMNIANQGFPATRADINNALQAIATNNSGSSVPSTTFANQWFYNTGSHKLFIRNEANNAFIEVATLDQTNGEWQITTGQISAADGDGLVFKTDDGTTRIALSDGGDVTFAAGTDVLTATAGTDNIRIGENAGDSIASGANYNVVVGKDAGTAISTGDEITAVGVDAGKTISTGADGTYVGYGAGKDNTGTGNTFVGAYSGHLASSGTGNTFIGGVSGSNAAGNVMTTGSKNTILGGFSGNQNGLDIRTSSNNIVLADGDGKPRFVSDSNGEFEIGGTPTRGTSNAIFKVIKRAAGNSSETFTSADMGMSDNITAMIHINLGGTTTHNHYAAAVIYWYMPRGGNSVIHQNIVSAFAGSGVTTFTRSVSGNSLVVGKDSNLPVSITVIGGGGSEDTN